MESRCVYQIRDLLLLGPHIFYLVQSTNRTITHIVQPLLPFQSLQRDLLSLAYLTPPYLLSSLAPYLTVYTTQFLSFSQIPSALPAKVYLKGEMQFIAQLYQLLYSWSERKLSMTRPFNAGTANCQTAELLIVILDVPQRPGT